MAKSGGVATWETVAKIEAQALVDGGGPAEIAADVVSRSITALKAAGVKGLVRIPWAGK
jgi:hypothetical protein